MTEKDGGEIDIPLAKRHNNEGTMLYPIHVNLAGKRCVVVGAGKVAERKVETLRAYGALIRLVAPQATPPLRQLADVGALTWMKNMYNAVHLEGAFLAIAATDLREINATVARDAQARNILVCCVDEPRDGNFMSPAQVTRGDLVFTVATSGKSPTLAAVLRERLETEFGPEWEYLAAILSNLRAGVRAVGDEDSRKSAVRRVIEDETMRVLLRQGDLLEAEARARECLSSSSE